MSASNGCGVDVAVVKVGPKLAEEWFALNIDNRRFRSATGEGYAKEMLAGRWQLSPDAIAFNRQGKLINGQHRLWAIIESKTSQYFLVIRNCKDDTRDIIDNGLVRSGADALGWAGVSTQLAKNFASVLRRVHVGMRQSGKRMPNSMYPVLWEAHKDAMLWMIERAPKQRGLQRASVLAAIVRAYYRVPRGDLGNFCAVLSSGMATQSTRDAAVITVRDFLLSSIGVGENRHAEVYGKVCRGIQAYAACETLERIYMPKEDPYPLPKGMELK
jgi:hypothetical protein